MALFSFSWLSLDLLAGNIALLISVLFFSCIRQAPTCVASAALKPYLENKSLDSASSLVCLITNQSARPSIRFSIQNRCNCWSWNPWEAGFGACRSCDRERRSLFVLLKAKRKKKKESQIQEWPATRRKIRQLSKLGSNLRLWEWSGLTSYTLRKYVLR